MSWSDTMRVARVRRQQAIARQIDWLDSPVLAYKLVCDGRDPLTNGMVKARKGHRCDLCPRIFPVGERVRRETRRSLDGAKIETRYACAECCGKIRDGRKAIEDRAAVSAMIARRAKRASAMGGRTRS